MTGYTYIDLTTLACWRGQPVGISRCQQKYADYAFRHLQNVRFTVFDPATRRHRHLEHKIAGQLIEGSLKVDTTMLPDLNAHRRHTVDRLPQVLRPLYWWVTKPRRRLIQILEKFRLDGQGGRIGGLAEMAQERLLKQKERPRYFDAAGRRVNVLALNAMAGPPVEFQADDTSLAIQSDWVHTDIASIARRKAASAWRHVILCHDIIPIRFPQWYVQSDVAGFKTYYDLAFRTADRVMFTSACTENDARDYCQSLGLQLKHCAVVPMGSDIAIADGAAVAMPDGLEPFKYAMFVSTIEPRKNHRLLIDAWRAMANSGVIERSGFKLVFVGRHGWQMGSLYDDIATDPLLKDTVVHLTNVDDGLLSGLYRNAAFCLYPPKFEGFGLPVIEALAYGKALLVSNVGPMPEIAGGFAIALDPENPAEWQRAMTHWIERPDAREVWAAKARDDYAPLSWDASAKLFFDKALAPLAAD
jgi:glycosyltransferase involved in cell wall biosynthesis